MFRKTHRNRYNLPDERHSFKNSSKHQIVYILLNRSLSFFPQRSHRLDLPFRALQLDAAVKPFICITTESLIKKNKNKINPQLSIFHIMKGLPPPFLLISLSLLSLISTTLYYTHNSFRDRLNASALLRLLINLNNKLLLCTPQRKTDYPFIID